MSARRMDVTIRRGARSDAEAVAELYLRARKAAAKAGSVPALVHTDADVREWMSNHVIAKLSVWIAEASGRAVGMLVLDGEWIDQLYVDPLLTGRGIGTRLLDVAKQQSSHDLRLWTFASNAGAQRFYERHGFRAIERTDGSRNEEGAPDIRYALCESSDGRSPHAQREVRSDDSGERNSGA